MNFNEYNKWKSEGYAKKTEEEYNQWKDAFKTWFRGREWTEWERNLIVEQVKRLDDAKKSWFEKQKSRPTITKSNYIFREEGEKAFTRLCNALATYLEKKV